jgi:hypothetical protein
MSILGPIPSLFSLNPPSYNVLDRVEVTPGAFTSVLGKIFSLFDVRLVLDSDDVAIIKQFIGPIGGMICKALAPFKRHVVLVSCFVYLLSPPIMSSQVLLLSIGHRQSLVVTDDDVMRYLFASIEVLLIDHERIIHKELVTTTSIAAADAITSTVVEGESILSIIKAHFNFIFISTTVCTLVDTLDNLI